VSAGGRNSPLVSILTPSFNQGRWLGDNIASVANQTYPYLEHIVVDGGSADETFNILNSADSRVQWVSEPDRGQSHALNKALGKSSGAIIGWLNSDDAYFDRFAVESVVNVFEKNPAIDIVYGHAALTNSDGLILQMMWVPRFRETLLRHSVNFIIQPAAFIRRSAIGDYLCDEDFDFSMDRELWLRLLASGCKFMRVDRVVAIDRHHPDRKVVVRKDLEAADEPRLRARYGVPSAAGTRRRRKVASIAFRLLGTRLVPRARGELAFAGQRDGALLRRQLLYERERMPVGFRTPAGPSLSVRSGDDGTP
jgi:glycosyltransferase involved in cell wall biosynthesis